MRNLAIFILIVGIFIGCTETTIHVHQHNYDKTQKISSDDESVSTVKRKKADVSEKPQVAKKREEKTDNSPTQKQTSALVPEIKEQVSTSSLDIDKQGSHSPKTTDEGTHTNPSVEKKPEKKVVEAIRFIVIKHKPFNFFSEYSKVMGNHLHQSYNWIWLLVAVFLTIMLIGKMFIRHIELETPELTHTYDANSTGEALKDSK